MESETWLPVRVLFNIVLLILVSKLRERNEYKERNESIPTEFTKTQSIYEANFLLRLLVIEVDVYFLRTEN